MNQHTLEINLFLKERKVITVAMKMDGAKTQQLREKNLLVTKIRRSDNGLFYSSTENGECNCKLTRV